MAVLSLSTMFSRFVYVVAFTGTSFLWLSSILVEGCHTLLLMLQGTGVWVVLTFRW